jgi:hypothetical protein
MSNNFTKVIKGYKIDPLIFTFKFNCKCTGECCHYGVYTDMEEFKIIMNKKDKLIPILDGSQTKDFDKWFEKPEKDPDFSSGIAVGTELHNCKCTFLDKNGLCSLQKLARVENVDKWKYKPLYCVLFPFTVFENTLTIDDEHIARLKTCNKEVTDLTIYESCKDELIHFLGEDGFAELETYRQEYFSSLSSKEVA